VSIDAKICCESINEELKHCICLLLNKIIMSELYTQDDEDKFVKDITIGISKQVTVRSLASSRAGL